MSIDVFRNLRGLAPKELIDFLGLVAGFFPDEFQVRLQQAIHSLPVSGDPMERALELIRQQWRELQLEDWVRIVLVGPSHTGKSSLLRAISQGQSPGPAPIFDIVELPGLEEYLGYNSGEALSVELARADMLILTLDGRYGISDSTQRMADRLRALGKPFLVLLNRVDEVGNRSAMLKEARRRLNTSVLPMSTNSEDSIRKLFQGIVASCPRALHPLTQSFPHFRAEICRSVVTQAAVSSSLIGALNLPVTDMVPLTAVQTGMLLKIARAFGHRLGWERIRELAPMLLGGLLAREGAHYLRERFPRQRTLIGVSVAGLWTLTLGKTAINYFEQYAGLLLPGGDLPAADVVSSDH